VSDRDQPSLPLFGALALLVLTVALMFGLGLGASLVLAYARGVSFAEAEHHLHGDLLSLTLVQLLAMGMGLALGLRFFDRETALADALSLRPVGSKTLALCLGAGACLQFPLTELSNQLHAHVFGPDSLEQQLALQNLLQARNLGQGLVVIFCIAGAIPLIEELLFRGLFLFGLSRRYGAPAGVLFSAVLFGVVHLGAVPALYASVAGLILGWLALTTGSVWPGVALHAAFNAIPVLLPESLVPVPGFNVPSPAVDHLAPSLVIPPLLVAIVLLALVRRVEYAASDE
jgi:membrane protease YdiL (CAAX protease family)